MRVANCVPQAQWELELYEERASQGKLYCRGTQLPPLITETGEKGRWNTPTCLSSLLSDLSPFSVSRWVEMGLQERDWVTRPVAVILQDTRLDREGWRRGVKRRITRTKRACLPFTEDRLYFTSHHSPGPGVRIQSLWHCQNPWTVGLCLGGIWSHYWTAL